MIKYNYSKAARIWDDLINITYDMPDYLDASGRQYERRAFMRALTRNDNTLKNAYLDYITDHLSEFKNTRFLDSKDAEKLEKIALRIVFFTNEVI